MLARIPDTLLASFGAFVEEKIGLHFPKERWPDLERGARAVAAEAGFAEPEAWIMELMNSTLAKEQVEALAAGLTIGETYFFRDKRAFELLETELLPSLIHSRRSGERRLRIWSAGCCTGEEPYSIAMVLSRLLPDMADWQVTILATDINSRFLRKAREGVYGQWSFRETPPATRARFFRETPGGWEIIPAVRALVTFAYLNLAEDAYPALATNTNAMDIIFCRNVLIYFAPERAGTVARKLCRSLVEGGWLIPSPSEASANLFAPLVPGSFPGAIVYRKPRTGEPPPSHPVFPPLIHSAPLVTWAKPPVETKDLAAPPRAEPAPAKTVAPPIVPSPTPALDVQARAAADRGDLTAALALCNEAIAADRLLPANHYLRGMILQEQGASDKAAESLKRALYLDQDFIVAHFALGNILLGLDSDAAAARHFDAALGLLRRLPADAALPESEGITAGRLLEIILAMKEHQ